MTGSTDSFYRFQFDLISAIACLQVASLKRSLTADVPVGLLIACGVSEGKERDAIGPLRKKRPIQSSEPSGTVIKTG